MFTIVAERIDRTRRTMREATERRDADVIRHEATRQAVGATFIDVNAGAHPDAELDNMRWLLAQVQAVVEVPISLDPPNPAVIAAELAALNGRALLNSISLEPGRAEGLLALAGRDAYCLEYMTHARERHCA